MAGAPFRNTATNTAIPISATRTSAPPKLVIMRTVFRLRDMTIAISISRLGKLEMDVSTELFRGVSTKAAGKRFKGRENGATGEQGNGETGGTGERRTRPFPYSPVPLFPCSSVPPFLVIHPPPSTSSPR